MKKVMLALLLLASPSFAQQAQPTAQDRIASQIGQLVIRLESQQDQITMLQADREKLQARVKELESAAKKDAASGDELPK